MSQPLKPYEGLVVLDAAQGIAAPIAACCWRRPAPPSSSWSRPRATGRADSPRARAAQRDAHRLQPRKRSLVLDLATPEGQARVAKLAARADILIEAFRPGVAARIGLAPEAAKADASASRLGFGQTGPYRERPCTDGIAQAFSGLVAVNYRRRWRAAQGGARWWWTSSPASPPSRPARPLSPSERAGCGRRADPAAAAPRCLADADGRRADVLPISESALLGRMPGELNTPAAATRPRTAPGSCSPWCARRMGDACRTIAAPTCRKTALHRLQGALRQQAPPHRHPARGIHDARRRRMVALLQGARLLCDRVNTPLEIPGDPHVPGGGRRAPPAAARTRALPFPAIARLRPGATRPRAARTRTRCSPNGDLSHGA